VAAADPDRAGFRLRVALVLAALAAANLLAWVLALRMAHVFPVLLGSALLAYGLGLRHAFDADHIAAIDNVTRRLVAAGQRPAGVGFFFSLGHASVVALATVGVALAASRFQGPLLRLQADLAPFGTIVSSLFLILVAALNLVVFAGVWRTLRSTPRGEACRADEGEAPQPGVFARRLDRVVRRISHSWMMFPLGLLFGLGFDTATEVGLLGLTAAQAAKGLALWSILVFPALFAGGMALADTLEALLMLGAYRWTSTRPRSRLYYNLTVTAASVLVAVTIALAQLASLAPRGRSPSSAWGAAADFVDARSEWIGICVVLAFLALWLGSVLADRLRRPDHETVNHAMMKS
jgi:high-affinity nickel-transport protein